jgi:hypothetical protein
MADPTITINANLGKKASAPTRIIEAVVDFTNVIAYATGGHLIAALSTVLEGLTFRSVPLPHYNGSATRWFTVNPSTKKVQAWTNAGAVTEVIAPTAGTVTDTTTYPVADQDTLTEKVTVDGGSEQTVTFAGATTTAAQVAAQMGAQLTGVTVEVAAGQVKITSNTTGLSSTVAIGTGTCGLTWAAPVNGTVQNLSGHTAIPVLLIAD